jgi:hypothetical protein
MCGSVSYRDAETTVPACHLFKPLPLNCTAEPLQNFHVEITSNILFRWYELMIHQNIKVKEFLEHFDCLSFIGSKKKKWEYQPKLHVDVKSNQNID